MSEPNRLLRIKNLMVQNFRCFKHCELVLHPTLTVLVAENAQGKTALLDALRLSLQEFVTTIGRAKQSRGFDRTDIHLMLYERNVMATRLPTGFRVQGEVGEEMITWSRVLGKDSFHARTSIKDTKDIRRVAQVLADRPGVNDSVPSDSPSSLPVVAYYGTGRLYDEHRLTEGKRMLAEASPARVSAYLDCLSPSSSYKSFATWFGLKWDQVSDPRYRVVGYDSRPENHIAAVRNAVRTVLEPTGWTSINWEPARRDDGGRVVKAGYIILEHPIKGRLPLTHLSDGVRNMVALVADIAHRCVRLNPFFGEEAATRTPGIVLIDEVEMHLHPRWQQLVIGLLQVAFPNIQFVVSTHSPHVLSTVDKTSIRLIQLNEQGYGSTPEPLSQTRGDESGNVLARAMHVDPVPDIEPVRLLSEYRALVQNGFDRGERAQVLWRELVTLYGEGHHLLDEAAVLRDLQEFKREYNRTAGGAP